MHPGILSNALYVRVTMEGELEHFLKWAGELGISDSTICQQSEGHRSCLGHSLSVENFPESGGRGLAATRDLKKGELILRVPKSALLTSDALLKDENIHLMLKEFPSLSSSQKLTLGLLSEVGKGKSSSWFPYLMQLPPSYHLLACFRPFEANEFQVDYAISSAEAAASKLKMEWKKVVPVMNRLGFPKKHQTFKVWCWATATISSRVLHVPWDDAGCLCPVGDLFNYAAPGDDTFNLSSTKMHSSPEELNSSEDEHVWEKEKREHMVSGTFRLTDGGYQEDVAAYCFYSRKDYRKGDQVLLAYGTYTNLELLEYYGFVLTRNCNDTAFIPLAPDICCSSSWPKTTLHICQTGKPSFALLSSLRLWLTPRNLRRSVGWRAYSGNMLSAENEIAVMNVIMEECHAVLDSMPTTIDEDALLLSCIEKSGNCSFDSEKEFSALRASYSVCNVGKMREGALFRWKLAVQWRLTYKKTLMTCISRCNKVIESFEGRNI